MTWFRRAAHPEEQLSAYVDGELDQAGRRSVEAHLASCEACTDLVRDLQATKAVVSELPRLEPHRSFTLGPEHARPPKPAVQRAPFVFAPAAALTLLVALLVVDVADFGGGGDDAGFTTANSRQAEPGEAAGIESLQPAEPPQETADAAESAADGAGEAAGGDEDRPAAFSAPSTDDSSGAAAADAEAPARPTQDGASEEPAAAAPAPQGETSKTGQEAGPEDSSEGVPLLRILQVLAGAAFVASSLVVFWPRLVGRGVR